MVPNPPLYREPEDTPIFFLRGEKQRLEPIQLKLLSETELLGCPLPSSGGGASAPRCWQVQKLGVISHQLFSVSISFCLMAF